MAYLQSAEVREDAETAKENEIEAGRKAKEAEDNAAVVQAKLLIAEQELKNAKEEDDADKFQSAKTNALAEVDEAVKKGQAAEAAANVATDKAKKAAEAAEKAKKAAAESALKKKLKVLEIVKKYSKRGYNVVDNDEQVLNEVEEQASDAKEEEEEEEADDSASNDVEIGDDDEEEEEEEEEEVKEEEDAKEEGHAQSSAHQSSVAELENQKKQSQEKSDEPPSDNNAHTLLEDNYKNFTDFKKMADGLTKNIISTIDGDAGVIDTLKDFAKDVNQFILNM
ncbi:merozoite surface protein 3, putative [Plasmodium vivax]|uniref:Merozoite surface protein 3, putative n=1 Tax=Plasmodium vivax TaxID=5855 RepID=A0A565A6X4_PLAVI|nr:merozoite surface protein 3, putative [Plasmodium vivax]